MTFASVRSAVDGEQSSHGTTIASGFGVSRSEDSDRHVSLALGGAVAVMDGPMPEFDSVGAAIAERVARVERFRQVLQVHRLDLGAPPHWAEDPTFDPHRHIHRAALPHGGDDQALFRFVADVMERRLDRDRPLWECWIIEGVAGGRWGGLLMKMHHCIADGIATMQMFAGSVIREARTRSPPTSGRPE